MSLSKQKKKLAQKKVVSFDTFNPINNTDEFDTQRESESNTDKSPIRRKKTKRLKYQVSDSESEESSDNSPAHKNVSLEELTNTARQLGQTFKQVQEQKQYPVQYKPQQELQQREQQYQVQSSYRNKEHTRPNSGFSISAENLFQPRTQSTDSFSITAVSDISSRGSVSGSGFTMASTMPVLDY